MGRIVINETENKQTVILNDRASGVSGGYFDNGMNWHEFGGADMPIIKVLAGKGTSGINIVDNPNRGLSEAMELHESNKLVLFIPYGYLISFKEVTSDGEITTRNFSACQAYEINTQASSTDHRKSGLLGAMSSCVLSYFIPNSSYTFTEFSTDIPHAVRLLFRKGLDGTDPVVASEIDGYMYAGGVWYHLVGE